MAEYRFEREARTPYSECYSIEDDEHTLGRVDLHYTSSFTHATLAVHRSLDDEAVQDLIAAIDEHLVSSADPYREDMVVTVWRGEEAGVYADESPYDEDEDDADSDGDSEDVEAAAEAESAEARGGP